MLCTFFMWYSFIRQIIFGIPVGNNPAPDAFLIVLWVIFGIAFPLVMLFFIKLVIEVRENGLYIRFKPFQMQTRHFPQEEINQYELITYSPLKRFGGWGIRINLEGEKAYNLNGNKGLKLQLSNETVVIGTQQPEELLQVMHAITKSD